MEISRSREDPACLLDQAPFLDLVAENSAAEDKDDNSHGEARLRDPLLKTWLLEPDLHTVESVDELPLPKNWTWSSNSKIWEKVRLEKAGEVNSSLVMVLPFCYFLIE